MHKFSNIDLKQSNLNMIWKNKLKFIIFTKRSTCSPLLKQPPVWMHPPFSDTRFFFAFSDFSLNSWDAQYLTKSSKIGRPIQCGRFLVSSTEYGLFQTNIILIIFIFIKS